MAAVLKRNGHQVNILDASLGKSRKTGKSRYIIGRGWDEIGSFLARNKPDLVGVGCPFTSRFPFAQRTVNLARECLPGALVVMGGVHPSISPVNSIKGAAPDYIIIGEGENPFAKLVRAVDSGQDLSSLDAVGGFNENGEIFLNPRLDLCDDLDLIPHPARELMNMEAYIGQWTARWSRRKNRQTSVITSRGCPQRCTFCAVHRLNGRKWRGRSAENVLEELEILTGEYRVDSIAFEDDNFTFNRERLVSICRGILERDLRIEWLTPNGVSIKTLDRETLALMRQSGCVMLNLAVESGDDYILNSVIRKKQSLEHIRDVALTCAELGIQANAYFVIGMPGETENSIMNSLEFAKSLPFRDVGVFIATPFPGTELHKNCVAQGYIDEGAAEAGFFSQPDSTMLHRAVIETPVMSKERIEWWEGEFHRRFWHHRLQGNPYLRVRLAAGKLLRKFQSRFLAI